jgi:CP family cyanate transporter-like MFS transporter
LSISNPRKQEEARHAAARPALPDVTNDPVIPVISRALIIAALLLVSLNLRPAISSVGLVLEGIRASTGISSAAAGILITLPVLCFGIFAPLAPRLARWRPAEQVIMCGLLGLAAGIGVRIVHGGVGLFAGTLLVSASIGIIMVLLPGIIKHEFPNSAGLLMGLYSMALNAGAALGSGVTVPIQHLAGGDWRMALLFWILPVCVAAAIWAPLMRRRSRQTQRPRYIVSGLSRSVLAWQLTAYMGFQTALAFCVFGWLPTILVDRGMTSLQAGYLLSLSILLQFVSSLGLTWLMRNSSDQRVAIAVMMGLMISGLIGSIYAPLPDLWLWAIVLGLGQGGSFNIAMTLVVVRAPNGVVAAELSGMVQGFGYGLAALGPLTVGVLHDMAAGWNHVAVFFVLIAVAAIVAGVGAGRAMLVRADVTPVN